MTIGRLYLQWHFIEWKVLIGIPILLKFVAYGVTDKQVSNGSHNGLALNRQKSIIEQVMTLFIDAKSITKPQYF